MGIRSIGMNKVMNDLKLTREETSSITRKEIERLVDLGKQVAREIAPKDKGRLVQAINGRVISSTRGIVSSMRPVGSNIDYHVFIETKTVSPKWGTRKGSRHRLGYMTQTLEVLEDEVNKSAKNIELKYVRRFN